MKAAPDDRRLWIECAVLAGLSALLTVLMDKGFSRYRPNRALPEEQPGDTPAAPWQMPKPEEKARAEPVRRTLERAVAQINSPEKADQVVNRLETLAGSVPTGEVEQAKPSEKSGTVSDRVTESGQRIKEAAAIGSRSAPPEEKAAKGIAQAAVEVTTSGGREKEAIAEATQETLNPEQQGAPDAAHPKQRRYLRQAVLKRMKPWDALDAEVYLAINHLPHNRWLNAFFYFFTFTFRGGMGWYAVLTALTVSGQPSKGLRAVRQMILPLAVATSLVEYPIKTFFRRRRPFIDVIQAIVIGKKPGSWSFPSGHSAAAFAGASLLARSYPSQRPFLYLLASLVAFSRIYLGDHYPGDVISGSFSGIAIASAVRRMQDSVLNHRTEH